MTSHQMKILNPRLGDEVVEWDPTDEKSVSTARTKFEEALKKGLQAFRIDRSPRQTGEQIKKFDPSLKEILLVPALQGG